MAPWSSSDPDTLARAVVRTIREPLAILNRDLHVRHANPAFYRVFDLTPAETVGRPLYDVGQGEWDIPRLRDVLETIIPRDSTVEDFEVDHHFHRIGRKVMLLNARRVEREEAGEDLILLAIEDVTERRRTNERLERTLQDLRDSNEDLEQFAYVASHDLQEPLRMVASFTRLLARRYEGELDERADKYIRFASEGAERMQTLINDLLEYSRVSARGRPMEPTDAGEVLDEVLGSLRLAIERNDARVTHDPLPTVEADRSQLTRIFQNLVENGLKFSGDEPPRIHVSASPENGMWRFSVRDEGIGIDPDYFDRIFVIFQRLGARDDEGGTGIGLALCRKIVGRHGGSMWVESDPGEGSTFHFTLPAAEGIRPGTEEDR